MFLFLADFKKNNNNEYLEYIFNIWKLINNHYTVMIPHCVLPLIQRSPESFIGLNVIITNIIIQFFMSRPRCLKHKQKWTSWLLWLDNQKIVFCYVWSSETVQAIFDGIRLGCLNLNILYCCTQQTSSLWSHRIIFIYHK